MVSPAANRSNLVTWSAASCANVTGYEIYRSADSLSSPLDTCCNELAAGGGFVRVGTVSGRLTNTFTDGPDLPFRGRYCYRVAPLYFDSTSRRNVRGCLSPIACVRQEVTFAVLLEADVAVTNAATGEVEVRWRRPDTSLLNPVTFPPPYTFTLQRAEGIAGAAFAPVATGLAFADTFRTVTGLNTVAGGHNFRVQMFDAMGRLVSQSDPASTIFLTVTPGDRALNLLFESRTGWTNSRYAVFRSLNFGGPYAVIDTVFTSDEARVSYIDRNLPSGVQQFYFVQGVGSYNNPAVHTDPLINRSNRASAAPVDTTAPCLPNISSTLSCEDSEVTLTLSSPGTGCDADLGGYIIYYKRFRDVPDSEYEVRDTVLSSGGGSPVYRYADITSNSFIGCYAVAAFDTAAVPNVSSRSEPVCLGDDCPLFALPNVFTPNGDGSNDRFIPLSYDPFNSQYVRWVTCWIYDRTGRLLSTSTDRNNLWDGLVNGSPAAEGTYYYVVELRLEGTERERKQIRTGAVTLLR